MYITPDFPAYSPYYYTLIETAAPLKLKVRRHQDL
jgi:hypothetical protein